MAPDRAKSKASAIKVEASGARRGSDSESGAGSESGSETSSEEGSAGENGPAADSAPPSTTTTTPRVSSRPFVPPVGFKSLLPGTPAWRTHFTEDQLAGKQIWHITAPIEVDISQIKEMAMDSIQRGAPVLDQDSKSYGFVETSSNTDSSRLLVPSDSGDEYVTAPKSIASTFQLREILPIPNIHLASPSHSTKQPRPQPKNLRIRYVPPGFGKAVPGTIGSEEEGEEEDEEFQVPPEEVEPKGPVEEELQQKREKKRQHHDTGDTQTNGVTPEEPAEGSQEKKKKKKRHRHDENAGESKHHRKHETPEERAARKERHRVKREKREIKIEA